MAKLPVHPDPKQLGSIEPAIRVIKAGALWHRIYRRGGPHPTRWDAFRHYGPTHSRFDHHQADEEGQAYLQDRGISYLAEDIPTAIAEVFQTNRTLDRESGIPWLVQFTLASDISVLDLTDTFLVKAGGSMKLVSGARPYARNWSQAFYEAYESLDGLYFLSSMTNRPVLVLYERSLDKRVFPSSPDFHRALADPLLSIPLQEACSDIGYAFT